MYFEIRSDYGPNDVVQIDDGMVLKQKLLTSNTEIIKKNKPFSCIFNA